MEVEKIDSWEHAIIKKCLWQQKQGNSLPRKAFFVVQVEPLGDIVQSEGRQRRLAIFGNLKLMTTFSYQGEDI